MTKQGHNKHRHHKQPQFYLKGFIAKDEEHPNTPSIWVYNKVEPPRRKGINNTAFTKDFYAFVEDDGSKNFNKYEDLLMRDFEQPANPIIEKLRRFEMIDETEKEIFSRYVASMVTRSDWARELDKKALEKTTSLMKRQYENEENISEINKIISNVKRKLTEVELFPKSIIETAEMLAEFIKKMNWRFLRAPKRMPFLTSDKPVHHTNLTENGSEVAFPISSDVAFLATWVNSQNPYWKKQENGFWEIDDKTVERIRKLIVSFSIKEVYFSKEAVWLKDLVNNRINTV